MLHKMSARLWSWHGWNAVCCFKICFILEVRGLSQIPLLIYSYFAKSDLFVVKKKKFNIREKKRDSTYFSLPSMIAWYGRMGRGASPGQMFPKVRTGWVCWNLIESSSWLDSVDRKGREVLLWCDIPEHLHIMSIVTVKVQLWRSMQLTHCGIAK